MLNVNWKLRALTADSTSQYKDLKYIFTQFTSKQKPRHKSNGSNRRRYLLFVQVLFDLLQNAERGKMSLGSSL